MNDNNLMAKRDTNGLVDWRAEIKSQEDAQKQKDEWEDAQFNAMNNGMLMRRDAVQQAQAQQAQDANMNAVQAQNVIPNNVEINLAPETKTNANPDLDTKPVAEKSIADVVKVTNEAQVAARQSIEKAKAQAVGAAAPNAKPVAQGTQKAQPTQNNGAAAKAGGNATQKPEAKPAEKPVVPKIKIISSPDALAQAYMNMFKSHFDLELSQGICFENMRKICEPNVKDPTKALYFIENTYRFSTLAYIASNLPVMIITSILAEKNRKGMRDYITVEIENAAKPFDKLWELRTKRYARKYEDMKPNDAITITPGVTEFTPELATALKSRLDNICNKMSGLGRQLTKSISKLDDAARNDVVYIFSNCWYFLQAFENVPEMRSYLMSLTDDTRKNLKL